MRNSDDPIKRTELGTPDLLSDCFNQGVLAHAIATADELGVFDRISGEGWLVLSVKEDTIGNLTTPRRAVLRVLEYFDIVETRGGEDTFYPGRHFKSTVLYKGFFTWLFSASGAVLAYAADLDSATSRGRTEVRDGALVAQAAADFGARHLDPHLLALRQWGAARSVVDLGCGDGTRLAELSRQFGLSVIGIDLSEQAIGAGRQKLARGGIRGSIELIRADVRNLVPDAKFSKADTLLSCLMGHDLWPRSACEAILHSWLTCFPAARTLILCETVRMAESATVDRLRIPTLGYEYLHALMGQYVPTYAEWVKVLSSGGWPVVEAREVPSPAGTWIFICSADRRRV